jgi:hypothetical protein
MMPDQPKRSLCDLIADDDLITAAIRTGIREELLAHAMAGNSVPVSENGQVVWISPPEILERLGYVKLPDAKAS